MSQQSLINAFSDEENAIWEYMSSEGWKKVKSAEKTENGVRIKFDGKTQVSTVMDKESRFIRCRFKRIPESGISATAINYRSVSSKVMPDNVISNETELSMNDFFPFEEKYSMYNGFYIKCDEVFSKKGATIKLSADLQFVKIETEVNLPSNNYKAVMNESDFASLKPGDIKIEAVKWEYWNGIGWAELKADEKSSEFFSSDKKIEGTTREISFVCPQDIETLSVGPVSGYFIRARIAKMSDRFDYYANYITPYVHSMNVDYSYGESDHSFKDVIVNSDLVTKRVNLSGKTLASILERNLCTAPAMYLCLENNKY